ncbi:MAG: hypothetical protein K2O10_06085, partial [Muribaculaceae bacterium]|nr:hypothetical protein [Muribaculaceae bacterium]
YTVEPFDFGEQAVPIFGHSNRTTEWWTNHYFEGDAGADEKAENVAILNYVYPTESPLIVDKVWLLAKANIGDNAEFKAEIIPLTDEFIPLDPIATATRKGSDMNWSEGGMLQYYTIDFEFEKPVALTLADAPAYIVKISGFNSDEVSYFAPMMQTTPTIDLCLGWNEVSITSSNGVRSTYNPVANFKNENGQEMWCAFAINLGGTYAYLKQANEGEIAEINAGKLVAEMPMISYYDGSEITVEVRKGFTAEITGRFNNAKLTITADKEAGASDGEFEAVLKAKGVELCKVPYHVTGLAAIDEVNGDATGNSDITGVYTVDGRLVGTSLEQLPAGIYLVRYANGTTTKIAL